MRRTSWWLVALPLAALVGAVWYRRRGSKPVRRGDALYLYGGGDLPPERWARIR